jgi:quercetin 2,3-dioxygenase
MANDIVLETFAFGFPWKTFDPFLFCVHHDDAYPAGNEAMGPAASLRGRNIGTDFEGIDGWRMYHGDVIPGFPRHPHRGFETLTLARRGYIDHSDSLGATARFGHGDAQWMTAGSGVVHSEMFPLVKRDAPNPTELFQLWINLPRANKFAPPHFAMLWEHHIPKLSFSDEQGQSTQVTVVAGELGGRSGPPPPPNSWASRVENDVAVWTIKMAPNAAWTLPAARPGSNRALYFFRGATLTLAKEGEPGAAKHQLSDHRGVKLRADAAVTLHNGAEEAELLLLQGRPIGEKVVQYGPFVMNEPREIQEAVNDYRKTEYGGWPWPSDGPAHSREKGRFAIHADGREESIEPAAGKLRSAEIPVASMEAER